MSDSKRLSLDVSGNMYETIEGLAEDLNTSKSDVLKRAVVLLEVCNDARRDGYQFGIAEDRESFNREIVGIFKGN